MERKSDSLIVVLSLQRELAGSWLLWKWLIKLHFQRTSISKLPCFVELKIDFVLRSLPVLTEYIGSCIFFANQGVINVTSEKCFIFLQLPILHSLLSALFFTLWEEITWLKAILCFPFSSSPCLRLQRFSSSPGTRNGLFCPQLTVTVLQLQLLQSLLSETVLWAEEEGRCRSLRDCLQKAPSTQLLCFNQVYFKVSLTVTSCAGRVSYHAVRCVRWIWPVQTSEGYFSLLLLKCLKINRGFELLSKVRGWWMRPSLLEA